MTFKGKMIARGSLLALVPGLLAITPAEATQTKPEARSGALVTVAVMDYGLVETYKVRVEDPTWVAHAEKLMKEGHTLGEPDVPHGRLVFEPSSDNPAYNWHIDPAGFSFVELASKGCDSMPSQVDHEFSVPRAVGYFCPHTTKIVDVERSTS